jgi:hypothetical protein
MKRGNLQALLCAALLAAVAGCQARLTAPDGTVLAAVGKVAAQKAEVKGHLGTLGEGEDAVDVLYLEGTPYQMGYTHGKLLADKIKQFYTGTIMGMSIGMGVPVAKLDEAWAAMAPFVSADIKEEMRGVADGAGLSIQAVQRAAAIPDLSEYHCSFFGAWGKATVNGDLFQIRALDYATEAGIQNYPVIFVYRPAGKIPFVIPGWAGFLGCITGISGQGIALSEIGDSFGNEKETLAGEPFPFLLRRVLETAKSLDQAVGIIQKAKRTSSYLYCVGDGKIPAARAMMTCKDFAYAFDPTTLPKPEVQDAVYLSMGVHSGWNEKVYGVLKAKWGHIDEKVGMYDVMRGLGTGDLQAVAWDVSALKMWVANCTSAPMGTKGKPAYGEDFLFFDVGKALGVQPFRSGAAPG